MYLIYIDDSGDRFHDLLSAVAIPAEAWSNVLAAWKGYRVWLERALNIPVPAEFHSEVILKRGSLNLIDRHGKAIRVDEPDRSKNVRLTRQVAYVKGLKTINGFQRHFGTDDRPVRLFTVHRPVANGSGNLYPELVGWIEEWLGRHHAWGLIVYDSGDEAKDAQLRAVHRNLPMADRRILEDPTTRRSHESHFLQMADMCAYGALQAIRQDLEVTTPKPHPALAGAYGQLCDIIEPGGYDSDGFPWCADEWKMRGWP